MKGVIMTGVKNKKSDHKKKKDDLGEMTLPPDLPPPYFMEKLNGIIQAALEKHGIEDPDEAVKFVNKHFTGKPIEELLKEYPPEPKDLAQDLVIRASQAKNEKEMLDLLNQALETDPENIDALSLIALITSENDEDLARRLEGILKCAESFLGKDYFQENRGHFWGLTETRPFMRGKMHLIETLQGLDRLKDAIRHCEEMLLLNPNDNQGVRYILLGLYLETDLLDSARKLLKEYKEDCSAVFAWGHVLERFLSRDEPGALKALKNANKENPFVLDYLTGKKKPPRNAPEYFSPGSKEEAYEVLVELTMAWSKHPDALSWLKSLSP